MGKYHDDVQLLSKPNKTSGSQNLQIKIVINTQTDTKNTCLCLTCIQANVRNEWPARASPVTVTFLL